MECNLLRRMESYRVDLYTYYEGGTWLGYTNLKRVAAHEFGHLLGIEDAYKYEKNKTYAPKNCIMRGSSAMNNKTKMNKFDVAMFLRAFAYNKPQYWSQYGMNKLPEYQ